MKQHILEPNVESKTFFEQEEIATYSDKLLKIVIMRIQYQLRHPDLFPAGGSMPNPSDGDPVVASSRVNGTTSTHSGPASSDAQPQAGSTSSEYPHLSGNSQRSSNNTDAWQFESDNRAGHIPRGTHSSRSGRAGGKVTYGRQDARYQSPSLSSHVAMASPAMPMQPRTPSGGSFMPSSLDFVPSMHPVPHFTSQLPQQQPTQGFQLHTCPVQGNFQPPYQHHLPGHMHFPPGLAVPYSQPFGDRSNFPNDGRAFSNESRLYEPDDKPKNQKQAHNNTNARGQKKRGHFSTRGGSRGHNYFGQTDGYNARNGRPFHRHSGSEFNSFSRSGQAHNDQRFSVQPRDKLWQPPVSSNENGAMHHYNEQTPHMANSPLASAPEAGSMIIPDAESGGADCIQHMSTRYTSGHQRVPSRSVPCAPTECNKYSIGEECTYATTLVIFQVPFELTQAAFQAYFSQFGHIESVNFTNRSGEVPAPQGHMSWVRFAKADSAREVLLQRGQPWIGGPLLYVEVANEHWDSAQPHDATHSISGRDVPSFMHPVALEDVTMDVSSADATATAPSKDNQKKKGSNKNKKPPRKKKSSSSNESLGENSKASATQQNVHSKEFSPVAMSTKIKSAAKTDLASGKVPSPGCTDLPATVKNNFVPSIDETTAPKDCEQADINASQCARATTQDRSLDTITTVTRNENLDENIIATVLSEHNSADATVKPSDDQADDSFHTADGTHGDDKDVSASVGETVSGCDRETSALFGGNELKESEVLLIEESTANEAKTKMHESIQSHESPSAACTAATDDSINAQQSPGASTNELKSSEKDVVRSVNDATSARSLTVTIPADDDRVGATSEKDDNGAERTSQARTVSSGSTTEAPTSAFVTAPSTPAIGAPAKQIKSKKTPKGPAQTESLSLFAKPKSRKTSSKKGKSTAELASRRASVNAVGPAGPATPQVARAQAATVPTISEDAGNTESEVNASQGDNLAVRATGSNEQLLGTTWGSLAGPFTRPLHDAVRLIVTMSSSPNSPPQDDKPGVATLENTRQSDAPTEGDIPAIRLNVLEEEAEVLTDTQSDKVPDENALGIFENATALEITTDLVKSSGSDENMPKKKKSKSKGKKKPKASVAGVTIGSHITVSPKASEPVHEFKGNDATSDSSSQTLGRTSPAVRRPSLKQIDEAKQPKALLEQRPIRQNRSRRHNSVNNSTQPEKTDSLDNAEDISVAAPSCTLILTPYGDGTYIVSSGGPLVFQWTDTNEQQEQLMAKNRIKTVGSLTLVPTPTIEEAKPKPVPEKPYDASADVEMPSLEAEKSKEKLRQLKEVEAAKKKKYA